LCECRIISLGLIVGTNFRDIVALIRAKQWTKNIFVLAALVFTRGWTVEGQLTKALLAMLAMCLVSSAVYIANDSLDRESDRLHPVKKNRPLASGRVGIKVAIALMVVLFVSGMALGAYLGPAVLVGIGSYLGLQVVYNLALKRHAVIDVFCISAGFVTRVVIGAVALNVALSSWILVCTGSLALLLGFGKRRHEFLLQSGETTRASLSEYTEKSLDMLVLFSGACAAMTYGIYSIESKTAAQYPGLVLTAPIVLYGICRYLLIVFRDGETGEPESLVLKDIHLILSFLGFIVVSILALNGLKPDFLGQ
jgi:4-hydroxybenzoate polyprenyltransferase